MRRDLTERGVEGEQGFMLVGLIVAIFLILLALSVAAPKVAQDLRREREVEAIHRGNQYVRAIRLYYRKTGMYPGSIEALEKTNNVRYLRQRYLDPMTGKDDWRRIKVGEAKTTVKGFFGQPLTGLTPGLGSAAGLASTGGIGTGAAGQQSGNGMSGGAPFVGVGIPKEGDSITILNEQTTYNTWEFIYDPRIEQLYAKGALMGGGTTGLGANSGSSSGFGATPSSGFGNTPSSGFGNTPSSGFGNTPSSGFGNTPGSGFGSTPASPSPTTPPQSPQQ